MENDSEPSANHHDGSDNDPSEAAPAGRESHNPNSGNSEARRAYEKKHPLDVWIFVFLVFTFLATSAAAYFTGKQWLTADDQERRSLRAYVTANGGGATISIEPTTKKIMMHGAVQIHNTGNTPAYKLLVKVAAKIDKRDATPFTEIGPIDDEYGPSILGPLAQVEIGAWTDYDPSQYAELEAGTLRTFIWGRVDYEDIFGLIHRWFEFREVSSDKIDFNKWKIAAHRIGESGN